MGWSFAGFNARLYASQYPTEVAGMVLVDSSHPDQNARLLAVLPLAAPDEDLAVNRLREDLTEGPQSLIEQDGIDFAASAVQVRAAGALGDVPLVVLTAGWPKAPALPADLRMKVDQVWQTMQDELAQLSSNSTHIIAEQSGHCIQCDQPDLVVEAIRQVVEVARRRAKMV